MLDDAFVLEHRQVGERHRARHGVAAEGDAVGEAGVALQEGLGQEVTAQHPGQGRIARRHALGEGQHVGLVAIALGAEPRAQAAERADHLVGHEEHAVAVTDVAHPVEIAGGSHEASAGVLQGLEEHRRHRVGPLGHDGALDGVRARRREPLVVVHVTSGSNGDRKRLVLGTWVAPGMTGSNWSRSAGSPVIGEGAHGGAVVGEVTSDHLGALGLADRLEVGAGELPGRLDRLGAARW